MRFHIVEYAGCLASNVHGWRELLDLANRTGLDSGAKCAPFVETAMEGSELVLVPGCMGESPDRARAGSVPGDIAGASGRGAVIVAVCAGVAAVLESGIDRGRTVTTHWSYAQAFSLSFPGSRIDTSRMVIDHGDLVTGGGVLAWVDAGLHVISRFMTKDTARACARTIIWDPLRQSQSPYMPPGNALEPVRPDPELEKAQYWILKNISGCAGVEEWSRESGLGARTFERRWKRSYGHTPAAWLAQARVALARNLLETGALTWEEITEAVGYEDPSRFRASFERETGWKPSRYREAFGKG